MHAPQVPPGGRGPGAPSLLLQEPLLSCVPHRYAQEVSRLCHLPAGSYRIVPSTYLPDSEGVFTVTIATRIDRWGPGLWSSAPQAHPPRLPSLPHQAQPFPFWQRPAADTPAS